MGRWAELASVLLSTVLLLALGVSFSTHAGPLWRDEVSTSNSSSGWCHRSPWPPCTALYGAR